MDPNLNSECLELCLKPANPSAYEFCLQSVEASVVVLDSIETLMFTG